MILDELQTLLRKKKLNGYIITRNNIFLGQDLLDEENQIMNLTGFTGSAGTLIATPEKAFLFVDGRYEIQAAQEVDTDKVEVVCGQGNLLNRWFMNSNNAGKKSKFAFNSQTNSIHQIESWRKAFPEITFVEDNSKIFNNNLNIKAAVAFEHKIEFAGIDRTEKLSQISGLLNKTSSDAFLFTSADSVSWLLNLRSDCLPDTPIIRAFTLVDKFGNTTLFADNLHFDFNLEEYINIVPMSKLEKELAKFKKNKIGIDIVNTPYFISSIFKDKKINTFTMLDPCISLKAVKNPVEIQGIEAAHLRDGVAMVKFLCWLDNNYKGKTELDIVEKLHSFRAEQENFYSESFGTIAGFGSNGAIVHYQPNEKTNKKLDEGSMLLLDSGAQYFDGTTDITRTIALGLPTSEMIDNFTLVLKSHITLASSYFPENTGGVSLDKIARSVLWQHGKDYNHGTGHGVGCFLNVHEGPLNMGKQSSPYHMAENMVVSIEPGYYKEGNYGIRIENLAKITNASRPDFEQKSLKFKILTLAPIDKNLINKYLLSSGEISWLNNYHKEVFEKISPFINDEEKSWLKDACSPL